MSGAPFASFLPAIALLTADAPGVNTVFPPQWGLFYQDGSPVIVSDAVQYVQYARDYTISDYPQEQGAFASYNKVQTPYTAHVGFLIGPAREEFLNNIEAAAAALTLVRVVVPETTYGGGPVAQFCNIIHYSYRREARSGVTLIAVEVWVEEVRVIAGAQVTSTAAQAQATGGTDRPIGQYSANQDFSAGGPFSANQTFSAGGSGNQAGVRVPIPPATGGLSTQSTNAASPQQSGQVQPQSPSQPPLGFTIVDQFQAPQPPPN